MLVSTIEKLKDNGRVDRVKLFGFDIIRLTVHGTTYFGRYTQRQWGGGSPPCECLEKLFYDDCSDHWIHAFCSKGGTTLWQAREYKDSELEDQLFDVDLCGIAARSNFRYNIYFESITGSDSGTSYSIYEESEKKSREIVDRYGGVGTFGCTRVY